MDSAIPMLENAYIKERLVFWLRYVEVLEKRSDSVDYVTSGKLYGQVAETII